MTNTRKDALVTINRGRTPNAKEQNKKWPEANPESRHQRIKKGEKRKVVRKKTKAKESWEYVA